MSAAVASVASKVAKVASTGGKIINAFSGGGGGGAAGGSAGPRLSKYRLSVNRTVGSGPVFPGGNPGVADSVGVREGISANLAGDLLRQANVDFGVQDALTFSEMERYLGLQGRSDINYLG